MRSGRGRQFNFGVLFTADTQGKCLMIHSLSVPRFVRALQGKLSLFRRRADGSAAVEFAIVIPVFAALLLGTIEFSLVMIRRQVLDMVAQNLRREILGYTTTATASTTTDIVNSACAQVGSIFVKCSNLTTDIRSRSSQNSFTVPAVVANSTITGTTQEFINYCDIVIIRMLYPYSFFITPEFIKTNKNTKYAFVLEVSTALQIPKNPNTDNLCPG